MVHTKDTPSEEERKCWRGSRSGVPADTRPPTPEFELDVVFVLHSWPTMILDNVADISLTVILNVYNCAPEAQKRRSNRPSIRESH